MEKRYTKKTRHQIPRTPGVYLFRASDNTVLYVGKATSLRSRVASYFTGKDSRGERIVRMVEESAFVEVESTDSVLEAVILESNLIKQYQPKYNVDLKDDKSFSFFVITKEEFPRILIVRQTNLHEVESKRIYGPYTSKQNMEIVLKILRRIFPFHSLRQSTEKGCLHFQIGLCPGPYAGAISKQDYRKNILSIEYVLRGEKKRLVRSLEREMRDAAKNEEFERAEEIKRKVFALGHIRDVALMKRDDVTDSQKENLRIEGYDISNISGEYAVASMVVFVGGKPDKSQYRKFKIRTVEGSNDVAMMREVLERRLKHTEWPTPDLILLDGGKGHLNMAKNVLSISGREIALASLAKGPTRKKLDLFWSKHPAPNPTLITGLGTLERVRDESHRFAIKYHRELRARSLLKTERR